MNKILCLIVFLGSHMLTMTNQASSILEAERLIIQSLKDKSALMAFKNLIIHQGVPEDVAERLCKRDFKSSLPQAEQTVVKFKGTQKGRIPKNVFLL
jgi:thymidine phosphorylase